MLEEIKNIKSGKSQLWHFGITFGVVLGLLGGLFLFRGKSYYFGCFIFSGIFLFLGLAVPILLKPVQKVWMSLAILVGWFVTRLILIILFYLVVTPISILARLFGKDFLDIKFDRDMDSYWIARAPIKFDKRSYENRIQSIP